MRAIYKNGGYYGLGRVVNGGIIFNQFDRYSGKPKHYLPFQSDTQFTLNTNNNAKNWDGILEYSTNTTTWNEWNGTSISSSSDGLLYLRGTGNTKITGSANKEFIFSNASNLKALGNIEYLLDWETVKNGEHPTMSSNCYRSILQGCISLTIPPELLATTLANSCYTDMFHDCTSLIIPPKLPATTLTYSCYSAMFTDCTSLTILPELPATTLAERCYAGIFRNCRNIKVSETQNNEYKYEWRIPTTGEILGTPSIWNLNMLKSTGGTFTGKPQINTTYYTNNPPIPTTPAPMNMSRVAMFGIEPNQCNDDENIKILNKLGVEQI